MSSSEPVRLVAIVGSLRAESFNRSVFRAAVELVGPDVELAEISLQEVPFYNGDVEDEGDPASVVALKEGVDEADGLIVFTPEYNGGPPAVSKNAIDWLSRVPGTSVLSRATVGIVAATPGGHEVAGVRAGLGGSIGANTDRYYETTLGIGSIHEKLTDGMLTDADTVADLKAWLDGFIEHVMKSEVS